MNHKHFEDVDTHGRTHIAIVDDIMSNLSNLHVLKEKSYQGSWCREGWLGTWLTVLRPWHRVENVFKDEEGEFRHIKDTIQKIYTRDMFDAVLDVAVYFVKIAAVIAQRNPEIYDSWQSEYFKESDLDYLKNINHNYSLNQIRDSSGNDSKKEDKNKGISGSVIVDQNAKTRDELEQEVVAELQEQ